MTETVTDDPPRAGPPGPDAPPRRLLANAISLFLAWLLPRVCLAGSVVVAARVLGADTFGAWGTAAAFAVILSILGTLGMQPLLVRELARQPDRAAELVRAADLIKGATTLLMMGVLFVLAGLLGYSYEVTTAAALLGAGYAIGAFVETRAARVQAEERMGVWAQASALYGIVAGGLGIVLVIATRSILWYCAATIVGQLVALVWMRMRAPVPAHPAFRMEDVHRLLRALLPFAAAFIALTLHTKVAVLLLARWAGDAQAGVFVAGFKFIDIAQALIVVLVAAAYPRLSRSFGTGGGPWTAGARLTEFLPLLVVPAAAALWLVREPAVALLFGSDYAAAVPVVGLLAVTLPALAINVGGAWVLGAASRMGVVAPLYALGVAVNVGLCALWVPEAGAVGAARALVVAEWSLALAMFAALHATAGVRPRLAVPLACAGIAVIAAGTVFVPDPTGGIVRALIVLAGAAALYARTGAVPARDRALLRGMLRPRSAVADA